MHGPVRPGEVLVQWMVAGLTVTAAAGWMKVSCPARSRILNARTGRGPGHGVAAVRDRMGMSPGETPVAALLASFALISLAASACPANAAHVLQAFKIEILSPKNGVVRAPWPG